MKRFAVAATLLSIAFGGTAQAADLARAPAYKAPPMMARSSWTGCYVGVGGGYNMWRVDHDERDALTGVGITSNMTAGGSGWLATGQVGCDYQFSDRWVVGLFGDFDWNNASGDYATRFAGGGDISTGYLKQTWGWAAGARLGYLVTPSLLTYVAGGFTQTHFNETNLNSVFTGASTGVQLASQTFNGLFLGTGAEYALDFFPGLFWKSEARASYFQAKDVIPTCVAVGTVCTAVGVPAFGVIDNRAPMVYSVRSELVYRFNWGGPVVARY